MQVCLAQLYLKRVQVLIKFSLFFLLVNALGATLASLVPTAVTSVASRCLDAVVTELASNRTSVNVMTGTQELIAVCLRVTRSDSVQVRSITTNHQQAVAKM